MATNLSALPRLALPFWLHAWAARERETTKARPLVLAFGLVRSAAMLDLTMDSLERHAPAGAALIVRGYASAAVFGAAHARLNRTTLRLRSIALFDVRALARPPPALRRCSGDAARAAEHRNELVAAQLLLHVPSHDWTAADAVVLWRLDTELVSDMESPTSPPIDQILVPHLQSGGLLNDRYLTGRAQTVRRLVVARAALLGSECVYGERALVRLVHDLRVRVAFTRTRVVRRRADLWVPDVDRAASLGSIPARGWMLRINALSPALVCNNRTAECTVGTAPAATEANRVFGVHGPQRGCPYFRAWESRCVWHRDASARKPPPRALPAALPSEQRAGRLLVLGDSLDAQLFAAVACHLHAHREAGMRLELRFEAAWENSVVALRKRCGADGAVRCHYTSAALHVSGADAARVPFASMHLCQDDRADCLRALRYDRDRDRVATGADALHGLAHKMPRALAFARGGVPNATAVAEAALRDARSVLALVPAERLVWREATAQHFHGPGGHWRHGFMLRSNIEDLEQRCEAIPTAEMRAHAHWNPAVAPLLQERGVRSVLRTWEQSARAWYAHVDHGDCTHFCQGAAPLEDWAATLLRLVRRV
jgi:hypothetical protein